MRRRIPQIGDIKTKRKFLLLPMFYGEYWYWWETVTLKYKLEWKQSFTRVAGRGHSILVKRWTLIDLRQDNE